MFKKDSCQLCGSKFEDFLYLIKDENGNFKPWWFSDGLSKDSDQLKFSEGEMEFIRRNHFDSIKCCQDREHCRNNLKKAITPISNTFMTTAVMNEKGKLTNFNIDKRFAKSMYGKDPSEILMVTFEVLPEENSDEESYWGWYDIEAQKFTTIWFSKNLLEMCFAYGIENAEKSRKGKAYALKPIHAENAGYKQ